MRTPRPTEEILKLLIEFVLDAQEQGFDQGRGTSRPLPYGAEEGAPQPMPQGLDGRRRLDNRQAIGLHEERRPARQRFGQLRGSPSPEQDAKNRAAGGRLSAPHAESKPALGARLGSVISLNRAQLDQVNPIRFGAQPCVAERPRLDGAHAYAVRG